MQRKYRVLVMEVQAEARKVCRAGGGHIRFTCPEVEIRRQQAESVLHEWRERQTNGESGEDFE